MIRIALTLVVAALAATANAGALFTENCSACHQPNGKGIPGAFPALDGDKFVVGDPAGPVGVVLHGRGGMPTFADQLTDTQIAEVLSDVRSSWGNKAKPITAAFVAKMRGGAASAKPVTLQAH